MPKEAYNGILTIINIIFAHFIFTHTTNPYYIAVIFALGS